MTTGAQNIAIGPQALETHDGQSNIAIGYLSMCNTDEGSTSQGSQHNVFIGLLAGGGAWANAASQFNVGIGNYVMDAAMNGALYNTAVGYQALSALVLGDANVAIGYQAGIAVEDGAYNILVGYEAGHDIVDGGSNICIGLGAGDLIIGADNNICIGADAGNVLTTGAGNVIIGTGADASASGAVNQTVIGKDAIGQANNSVTLGNSDVSGVYRQTAGADTSNLLYMDMFNTTDSGASGIVFRKSANATLNDKSTALGASDFIGSLYFQGSDTNDFETCAAIRADTDGIAWANNDCPGRLRFYTAPDGSTSIAERLRIDNAGDTHTNDGSISSLSDIRAKKDIVDLQDGLSIINQLKPKTFKYNGRTSIGTDDGKTRYGFIADDVLDVAEQYVTIGSEELLDEAGNGEIVDDFKSLSMVRMFPMLVKAVQELSAKVTALENAG